MGFNTGRFNTTRFNAAAGGAAAATRSTSFGFLYTKAPGTLVYSGVGWEYTHAPQLSRPWVVTAGLVISRPDALQLPLRVNAPFSVFPGERVSAAFEVAYSLLHKLNAPWSLAYDVRDFGIVNAPFEVVYDFKVSAPFAIPYSIRHKVNAPHAVPAGLVTVVNAPFGVSYSVLGFNPVSRPFRIVYNVDDATIVDVTSGIVLTHAGEEIGITQGVLEMDEGGFNWRARVELADVRDYPRFAFNDDATLTIYGESYAMMVQSRARERDSPADVDSRLELLGVAARLDTPIATPITQAFGAIGAHAAAEQILGASVTWNIVDWVIPAGRLAGDRSSPVELARKIVEAAGGRLEAQPDGTLVARPLYPVPVADYATAAMAHTYSERDKILQVSEGLANQEIVNRIRIRDGAEAAFSDRMVFEADDDSGLRGDLFLYPSPYRPVTVRHTGPLTVSLLPQNPLDVLQDKEEVIEIREGTGTVGFPVHSIQALDWLEHDLGGLTFEAGSTTVTATGAGDPALEGHSLVRVSYRTRAKHWRTSSVAPIQVQYLNIDEAA